MDVDLIGEGRIFIRMTAEQFKAAVQYAIIVERWESKRFGRVRRAWQQRFSLSEREKIAKYATKFHRWHLVSGTPEHVFVHLRTLNLLRQAVAFFAEV